MDLKEKIIKFLNEETSQVRTLDGEEFVIMLDNYKEDTKYLADELIKLFYLHSFSKRKHQNTYDWGYINGYDDCIKGLPKRDDLGVYDD